MRAALLAAQIALSIGAIVVAIHGGSIWWVAALFVLAFVLSAGRMRRRSVPRAPVENGGGNSG